MSQTIFFFQEKQFGCGCKGTFSFFSVGKTLENLFLGLFAFAESKLQRVLVLVVSTNVTTEYSIVPEHV